MYDFIQCLSDEFQNIYFLEGDRKGNYPFSNSLLVGGVLIDTGISGSRLRKIKKQFQIDTVVLSHWHEDHVSGNNIFQNLNFLCHEMDKIPIEDIEQMLPYYKVEGTKAGEEFKVLFDLFGMKNTTVSRFIKDNEIINIDENLLLKVSHTPGHTAGHCSFIELHSKIAFFGDMDLTRFPYYATIDSDLKDYENSIEKLKALEAEIAVVGHKEPVFGKQEIQNELDNFKGIIHKRDERLLANFSEKIPIQPIDLKGKNLIYKKYNHTFEIISGLVMIEKHFDKFLKNGLITREADGFILK
jgi:glyoxylase-like metal-dependent hydrolase (beta-lactamase superfamily II)